MTEVEFETEEMVSRMAATRASPEPAEVAAARRMRVVGSLFELHTRILEKRSRRRAWQRRAGWLAFAAMPLLAAGAGWYVHALSAQTQAAVQQPAAPLRLKVVEGTVRVAHGGRLDQVAAPETLGLDACEELVTLGDARAALVLESGTRVEALAATRLGVSSLVEPRGKAETIDVNDGQVEVAAPKLGRDRFLSVRTPDTTVEVRGTKFSVAVQRAEPTTVTRVVVTEGRVLVRHDGVEIFLSAGSSWSSEEDSTRGRAELRGAEPAGSSGREMTRASPRAGLPAGEAKSQDARAAGLESASNSASSTNAGSRLGAQIRLFKRAMQARREGDDARAVTLLEQLLAEFPNTPMAQEARVERFRALGRMGQSDASAREARRYLADYPGGFATGEARSLALERAPAGSSR